MKILFANPKSKIQKWEKNDKIIEIHFLIDSKTKNAIYFQKSIDWNGMKSCFRSTHLSMTQIHGRLNKTQKAVISVRALFILAEKKWYAKVVKLSKRSEKINKRK